MSLKDRLERFAGQWVFKVAAKRVGASATGLIVGALTSEKVVPFLKAGGIKADSDVLTVSVSGIVMLVIVTFHDWIRLRKGFEWL